MLDIFDALAKPLPSSPLKREAGFGYRMPHVFPSEKGGARETGFGASHFVRVQTRMPVRHRHSLLGRAAARGCRLAGLVLALGLLSIPLSSAMAASFAVELNAPSTLKPILEKYLQIYVEIGDPSLTRARFRYLARRTGEDIKSILNTEGYFSPVVDQRIETTDDHSVARFEVDPGPPSRIASIDLELRGTIAEDTPENRRRENELRRALTVHTGDIFRNADWEKAKDTLLLQLHAKVYPAARIMDSQATVDPEAHAVALRIVADSGPAFTFGDLRLEGFHALPTSVVTRVNRIKPGSPYDAQDLADLQDRLQQTNYFRSVFVTTPTDPAHPQDVPVQVSVVENTARKIGIGIGYSTDVGAGIELRYEDNLTFRPGWRSRSTLKLDQSEQSLAAELYLVPIFQGLQPRLDAQVKQSDIQNDRTTTSLLGGRLLRYGAGSEWTLSLELRKQRKETNGVFVSAVTSMPLNLSWTRRTLDDPVFPSKGYVVNLQGGGVFEQAISDQRFVRLYGRANRYWPIGSRDTLIVRGEVGAVDTSSRENIPDDYLFRAGGSQSVRGYAYGALGIDQNGAIVPGRYLAVGSVEVSHRVAEKWAVSAFYDAGNVVDRWQDFSAVKGYGLGVRWRSPVGPLNVDLAYGAAVREFRLHFSVGAAF
jgi:translocation and assembly module TamA